MNQFHSINTLASKCQVTQSYFSTLLNWRRLVASQVTVFLVMIFSGLLEWHYDYKCDGHCFVSFVRLMHIFLFNKTERRTNFPNLFCQETLHVSGISSAHHQEFFTVHSALVYVMDVWWQLSSTTWSCSKAVIKPAWHIPVPNVQWKTPDDGQRKCPKHVEFLDKINLGN